MDAKTRILRAGARIVHQKGFFDTGLAEVLDAADVPKGSFYFHFKNKEEFGLQLIDYFAERLRARNDRTYQEQGLSQMDRIRLVFRRQAESFRSNNFKGGCPIGNLALEMADRNPEFRKKLGQAFAQMKRDLAGRLRLAREQGEIPETVDVEEGAEFILSCWEGALMQMKVSRSTAPHELFDRMVFHRLLQVGETGTPMRDG